MLKELLYFSDLPPLFILVLMEDTLRAGSSSKSEVSNSVLILVLMEDTLRGIIIKHSERRGNGLNPCSNGRYSQNET